MLISEIRGLRSAHRHRRGGFIAILLIALSSLAAASSTAATSETLDLQRHRGHVVIVDFWASWCAPCRRSLPWLDAMQSRYGASGLVVIGVNVDRERADAERFLRDTPVRFRIVYDPEGRLPEEFGVKAMPSSYVFDRDGRLTAQHLGFQVARQPEYEATLRKLLDLESTEKPK